MVQDLRTADPNAPVALPGSTGLGVLVIHGFTSRPASVLPWAAAFAEAGHAVQVPLLPGHATQWQDMNRVSAEEWMDTVVSAYDRLAEENESVAVAGLSMGGTLACHVAAVRRPSSLILLNPALAVRPRVAYLAGLLKTVLPSTPAVGDDIAMPGVSEGAYDVSPTGAAHQLVRLIRRVRRELAGIDAPLLLLRSAQDHVVPDESIRDLLAGLTPRERTRVRRVALDRSFHVATLDYDASLIEKESVRFVGEHA